MEQLRTFIAIEFPADIKQELSHLQQELASPDLNAKWVSRENIHLTLKFLGSVPSNKIGEIGRALRECLQDEETFSFVLSGLGAFPSVSRPKVVWVGIEEGKERLRRIARKIEAALEKLGFPKEKRGFSAHVTLSRIKKEKKPGGLEKRIGDTNYTSHPIRVPRIALMKSDLTSKGPIYSTLDEVKLA
jgi:2'-5' RNA ligase